MKNRSLLKRMVVLKLILLALAVSAFAQSTNQSSPTAITKTYVGKGPSKETTYYFSFTGGPGEVAIKLQMKAKTYSTFGRLEVLDAGMHTLATLNMNAATSTGPAEDVRQIDLDEKQTVILKVTLDSNLLNYQIHLTGAVASISANILQSGSEGSNGKPKFSSGQHINVAQSGTLIITMKDGTKQEFDLATVKSVDVKDQ